MTIADKAMVVTGANRGIGQTLVEEAPSSGAKRVDAGTPALAHPDGRGTLLTLDVTSATQTHAAADRQGSTTRSHPCRARAAPLPGTSSEVPRWRWHPPGRNRCTTGSWTG